MSIPSTHMCIKRTQKRLRRITDFNWKTSLKVNGKMSHIETLKAFRLWETSVCFVKLSTEQLSWWSNDIQSYRVCTHKRIYISFVIVHFEGFAVSVTQKSFHIQIQQRTNRTENKPTHSISLLLFVKCQVEPKDTRTVFHFDRKYSYFFVFSPARKRRIFFCTKIKMLIKSLAVGQFSELLKKHW